MAKRHTETTVPARGRSTGQHKAGSGGNHTSNMREPKRRAKNPHAILNVTNEAEQILELMLGDRTNRTRHTTRSTRTAYTSVTECRQDSIPYIGGLDVVDSAYSESTSDSCSQSYRRVTRSVSREYRLVPSEQNYSQGHAHSPSSDDRPLHVTPKRKSEDRYWESSSPAGLSYMAGAHFTGNLGQTHSAGSSFEDTGAHGRTGKPTDTNSQRTAQDKTRGRSKLSKLKGAGKRVYSLLRPGRSRSLAIAGAEEEFSSQDTVSKPERKRSKTLGKQDVDEDEADCWDGQGSVEIDGDADEAPAGKPIEQMAQQSKGGFFRKLRGISFSRKGKKKSAEGDVHEVRERLTAVSRRRMFADGYHTYMTQTTLVGEDTVDFGGNPAERDQDAIISEVAGRLGEIGDMINVSQMSSLPEGFTYSEFESLVGIPEVTSWSHVAKVFKVAGQLVNSVGAGTSMVKEMTLRYIADKCADWILANGGFPTVLGESTDSGTEVD